MAGRTMPDTGASRNFRMTQCADCALEIPNPTGRTKRCGPCAKSYRQRQTRDWKRENAEKNRLWARDWHSKNRDKVAATARAKRSENLEAERAKDRDRYKAKPERARAYAKEWYRRNRDVVLARMASPEGRQYSASKMRERLSKNPQFKLHSNTSRAIRTALGGKKGRKWEELVGYTADQLRLHIEKQFLRGMGWHNYGRGAGKWHIDHIVPQSAFTFTSPEDPDFRACWALTNLRPLWGDKNISKHASREFLI